MSFQKNFTFFDKAHKNSEVVKIFRKTVGAIHESPVTNDYHFLYSDYPLSRATDGRPYGNFKQNALIYAIQSPFVAGDS